MTNTMKSLSEIIRPEYYEPLETAVQDIRKDNKKLALALGSTIKKVCLFYIGQGIKTGK